MPAIATTGKPQDPGFANLTHKIVQLVMASANRASVAAGGVPNVKLPQDRKSLEYAFEPLFSGSGARERQLRRAFGRPGGRVPIRLTGIDFADNRSVVEQAIMGNALESVKIAPATFATWRTGRSQQEITQLISSILKFRRLTAVGTGSPTSPVARKATHLELRIARLRCIERVGWEATDWDGKDVINCGGLGFDSTLESPPAAGSPSTPHFRKVPPFNAGTFPEDGKINNFNPDKVFCKWDLSSSGEWPRGFIGIIAMGEKDSGKEFPQLIEDIWGLLSASVIAAVSSLVTAAIGAGIGAAIGTEFAPLVGTAIGAVVGAIVGAVVGAIADTLRDDILETSDTPVTLVLPSPSDTMPGGGATSDTYTAEYVRPGMPGIYHLEYYWQLVY